MSNEAILGIVGLNTALIAALGYLMKLLLETRLKAAVAHEYSEMKAEIDHKYNVMKAALEHEYKERLEHLKDEIQDDARIRQARWEIKRQACLEALAVVDAVYSHMGWKIDGKPVEVAQEKVDVAAARAVMNKLALACDGTESLEAYMKALAVGPPHGAGSTITGDVINGLRNAARKELGFGNELALDREMAWIANLAGAKPKP